MVRPSRLHRPACDRISSAVEMISISYPSFPPKTAGLLWQPGLNVNPVGDSHRLKEKSRPSMRGRSEEVVLGQTTPVGGDRLNEVFNIRMIPQDRHELAGPVIQAVFDHLQKLLHEEITDLGLLGKQGF